MIRSALFLASSMFLALTAITGVAVARKVKEGVTQGKKLHGGGGPTGQSESGDFQILHSDGFKGAQRVAISAFNVAFPDENTLSANMHNHDRYASYSAKATMHTVLQGVDQATRQRIADAAYAGFVGELKKAGFEVVDQDELTRLAPEFATWKSVPNFTSGRFGTYVAPTGRALHLLQGDEAKRDASGRFEETRLAFRAFNRTQASTRSAYLAHDAKLGIIAVTLVVDYGVYSTSGETKKVRAGSEVGFRQEVAAQSGTLSDTGTLVEYWGPKSGGFAAIAALAVPVTSDLKFADMDDSGASVIVKADGARFEKAAMDVAARVNVKLAGALAAER